MTGEPHFGLVRKFDSETEVSIENLSYDSPKLRHILRTRQGEIGKLTIF